MMTSAPVLCLVGLLAGCRVNSTPDPGHEQAGANVAVVSQAPRGTSPPAGSNDGADACARICKISQSQGCAVDGAACRAACQEMRSDAQCQRQMLAALSCMAELREDAWECSGTGFPELRAGHCDAEQGAMVTCLGR
jgi:hypothetical protein